VKRIEVRRGEDDIWLVMEDGTVSEMFDEFRSAWRFAKWLANW
jgi:hypothetical protein